MKARIPTPRKHESSKLKEKQHIPKPYKLRRYYLPSEVTLQNTADNCWISFFNKVFYLTLLLQSNYKDPACDSIVLSTGTDVTHWFDKQNMEVRNSKLIAIA